MGNAILTLSGSGLTHSFADCSQGCCWERLLSPQGPVAPAGHCSARSCPEAVTACSGLRGQHPWRAALFFGLALDFWSRFPPLPPEFSRELAVERTFHRDICVHEMHRCTVCGILKVIRDIVRTSASAEHVGILLWRAVFTCL